MKGVSSVLQSFMQNKEKQLDELHNYHALTIFQLFCSCGIVSSFVLMDALKTLLAGTWRSQ
jgi:hypothetical protein